MIWASFGDVAVRFLFRVDLVRDRVGVAHDKGLDAERVGDGERMNDAAFPPCLDDVAAEASEFFPFAGEVEVRGDVRDVFEAFYDDESLCKKHLVKVSLKCLMEFCFHPLGFCGMGFPCRGGDALRDLIECRPGDVAGFVGRVLLDTSDMFECLSADEVWAVRGDDDLRVCVGESLEDLEEVPRLWWVLVELRFFAAEDESWSLGVVGVGEFLEECQEVGALQAVPESGDFALEAVFARDDSCGGFLDVDGFVVLPPGESDCGFRVCPVGESLLEVVAELL